MDCPSCFSGAVEREGTQHARLFQCRFNDNLYMVARAAFEAFVALNADVQLAALQTARRRSGQAVPVITLDDMIFADAWREAVVKTESAKARQPPGYAPMPHNDF